MTTTQNFTIQQGKTFTQVVRWETLPYLFAAIAGVTNVAPVAVETETAHGIPSGWKVAVVDSGVSQLDATKNPPADKDFRQATVVDTTHINFNPLSGVAFDTWEEGGYLQWFTPHDLAGYTARLQVKDKVGGTVLLELTTENGGIALDDTEKTITLTVSAEDTAAITDWTKGVYDLELVSPGDVVTAVLTGKVTVEPEITT